MATVCANMDMTSLPKEHDARQVRFSPYTNNGGTCIGVCGKDYAVLAADTRMSEGYSIDTRKLCKLLKLTDKCVLATSGMQADMCTLHKILKSRMVQFEQQHGRLPTAPAIAQMLSNTLYYRRFFPYYTFNVLGGVDEDGNGAVWNYDAVGSYERVSVSTSGTGESLVQPVFDNQLGWKQQKSEKTVPIDEARDLVKDAFTSAGERDIYTGDEVDIFVVTKDGVTTEKFSLKRD